MNYRSLFLLLLVSFRLTSQTNIQIQIPESYELSNILLALTEYGRADQSEVQKKSNYYKEVIAFFEPVKDHPLLKQVNYSRQLWQDYLSFRTDAVAFSFTGDQLKRTVEFNANTGRHPFDQHLNLVNDFVKQSNFRMFYKLHQGFYDSIVSSYRSYYLVNEMMSFLKKECNSALPAQRKEYKIILSPLTGRLNCYRDIGKSIVAVFPSLALSLIDHPSGLAIDKAEQAVEIHTLFIQADQGFINPLAAKFEKKMDGKIAYEKWCTSSEYQGIQTFNEYMTWAVYDLFIFKYFPGIADSVCTQWHYQNGGRGFFASAAFAKKLRMLYTAKTAVQTLIDLYPKIIYWCTDFQKDITLPVLLSSTEPRMIQTLTDVPVELVFSESMAEKELLDVNIISLKDRDYTTSHLRLTKQDNKITWSDDGKKLNFILTLQPVEQSTIQFNWWGCHAFLESKKGVMLKVFSKIVLNQQKG